MKQIIPRSPFKWSDEEWGYYFRAVEPESGLEITGSLFIPSVIKSLLEAQGECDIAVCGCGDAGCAGFFGERFRKTADLVVWDINCNGEWYNLRFDRGVYERDAIAMLKDMVKRNIGWNEFAVEQFRDFAAFEAAVAKVVMTNRERKRQAAREDGQMRGSAIARTRETRAWMRAHAGGTMDGAKPRAPKGRTLERILSLPACSSALSCACPSACLVLETCLSIAFIPLVSCLDADAHRDASIPHAEARQGEAVTRDA